MFDIDVIFVISIPPSLTGRDKSWRFLSFHVLPLNRDVIKSCQMTFSIGCRKWVIFSMV